TLQAGHQHDGRWLGLVGDPDRLPAQRGDELLVDDVDDLLRRVERLGDLDADGALPDAGDEVADNLEVDVGLEEGEPDLAQHLVDLGLTEATLAAEALEDPVEAIGE